MFNQISILGVGLLGASLAMAIRENNLSRKIKLWAHRSETLEKCKKEDWCDEYEVDLLKSVLGSDFIIICTPVENITSILRTISPSLENGSIVTDVGSVKGKICIEAENCFRDSNGCFVGSHPMAGSEKSGMEHAKDDLFVGKTCVVTPLDSVPLSVKMKINEFWKKMLMKLVVLSPDEHDRAVAYCSHLPHLISSTLAKTLGSQPSNWFEISGNGLKDTTRIAEGNPELWKQIIFMNKNNLIKSIENFESTFLEVKKSLENNDPENLYTILKKGAEFRKKI